jgi:hypothetical protein
VEADIDPRRGRASCSLRRRLGRVGLVGWVVLGEVRRSRIRGRRRIGVGRRVISLGRAGVEVVMEEVKVVMEEVDVVEEVVVE